MYERLGEASLKTGERMEIGVITAPDPEWRERIVPFLGHKPEPYSTHIERCQAGPLDDLETRFYVGHIDGRLLTQVMIAGARGAGILGHVYTHPGERRKGAYQAVMAAEMTDVARRGFHALALGTGFDSPPYWIYHHFGFRGIGPGRGEMKWAATEDAEAELFRPGRVMARAGRWDDWGYFGLLGLLPVAPDEELPRSRFMRLRGQSLPEGPFVRLMLAREQDPSVVVRVLQSEHGATVAWAILSPDPSWFGDAWLLDVHTHPNFATALPDLLASVPWPDAPVAAALTGPPGSRAAALQSAGFDRVAGLPAWFRTPGDTPRRDVGLWVRP